MAILTKSSILHKEDILDKSKARKGKEKGNKFKQMDPFMKVTG